MARNLAVLIFGLLLLFLPHFLTPSGPGNWVIQPGWFGFATVDVGAEGMAQLAVSPGHHSMLIDTGDNNERVAWPNLERVLKDNNVQTLDYLVISHPHQDHLGNVMAVLKNFKPKIVVLTGVVHTNQIYEEMLTYIRDNNIPTVQAKIGSVIDFDPEVKAEVLGPNDLSAANVNNTSIILKLTYKSFSVLFSGDAEVEEEGQELSSVPTKLGATILNAGHHGSYTSNSEAYLKAVKPEAVIISAGWGNQYGHPHQVVLDRLSDLGINTLITRDHGTITVVSNGDSYEIRKER